MSHDTSTRSTTDDPWNDGDELRRANGIPIFQPNFTLLETFDADEAFQSGTFGGMTPVGPIEGVTIGTAHRSLVTTRVSGLYRALVDDHRAESAAEKVAEGDQRTIAA